MSIPSISINKNGDVSCIPTGYHVIANPEIVHENMGSLDYDLNNNYWISQNYIYQYGGVFLQQDTGGVVKLLPSITIEQVNETTNLGQVTILWNYNSHDNPFQGWRFITR